MTLNSWREWRHPVEFALLLALAFFLPLREAPKNIFWLLFMVAWCFERYKLRDAGGRLDGWDALIAALAASGYLAAAFGGIHRGDGNEWMAVNDIWRYGLLFMCVRRGGYSDAQKLLLVVTLTLSCTIAEIEAIWNWKVRGVRGALELFSVGHVNHSAIYMAISLGLASGLLAACWRQLSMPMRAVLGACSLALLTGLFLGGSRAAGATGLLIAVGAAFIGARSARIGRGAWLALIIAIGVAALVGGTSALQRQIEWGGRNYSLAQRDLIWNRGMVGWRANPAFGLGMENYGAFNTDTLKGWLVEQGRAYHPEEYSGAPHAHSLYINTLVERGVVGLVAILLLLAAWATRLVRTWPGTGAPGIALGLWYGSASAWLVTMLIGFANTTLHHEHAMLAMLALALACTPRLPGPARDGG